MKRLLFTLLAASLGAACAADNSPLLLGNFRHFSTTECAPEADPNHASIAGRLDVSGTTRYVKYVTVVSQTASISQPGTSPSSEVTTSVPNEIIVDRVWLDYESNPDIGLAAEDYPLHFVIDPGSTQNVLLIEFFPGEADDTLRAEVVSGLEISVVVGLRISGRTRGGTPVQSNRVEYPINVYNSGFQGCAAGEEVALNGPCATPGGQDNAPPTCCPAGVPDCAS